LKTAEASGLKVIKGIPDGLLRKVLQ
jgi:hypothetical protein